MQRNWVTGVAILLATAGGMLVVFRLCGLLYRVGIWSPFQKPQIGRSTEPIRLGARPNIEASEYAIRQFVCTRADLLVWIQRMQWEKAAKDLFGAGSVKWTPLSPSPAPTSGGDLSSINTMKSTDSLKELEELIDSETPEQTRQRLQRTARTRRRQRVSSSLTNSGSFDWQHGGFCELDLRSSSETNYATLAYYNHLGGDAEMQYTQSLLLNWAYAREGREKMFFSSDCIRVPSRCQSPLLHCFSAQDLANQPPNKYLNVNGKNSRYSFMYTSDPLQRFLENLQHMENTDLQRQSLNFIHELGTVDRVMEAIRWIIWNGGSNEWREEYKQLGIDRFAPLTGPMLAAVRLEKQLPHFIHTIPSLTNMTKVGEATSFVTQESFSQGWLQVFDDVRDKLLLQVHTKRPEKMAFPSVTKSTDTMTSSTMQIAAKFLSLAGNDVYQRIGLGSNVTLVQSTAKSAYSPSEYRRMSTLYLRSLCRVYLSEYVCLEMPPPQECQSLLEDWYADARIGFETSFKTHRPAHLDIWDYIRPWISQARIEFIARYVCFFSSAPDCEARLVYGATGEDDNPHDEL